MTREEKIPLKEILARIEALRKKLLADAGEAQHFAINVKMDVRARVEKRARMHSASLIEVRSALLAIAADSLYGASHMIPEDTPEQRYLFTMDMMRRIIEFGIATGEYVADKPVIETPNIISGIIGLDGKPLKFRGDN